MGLLSRIMGTKRPMVPAPRQEPVLQKGAYTADQPLSTIAGSPLYTAFSPMANSTGVAVTPFTALQASAVFGCMRCLTEDFAKLPVKVLVARPNGGWAEDLGHPLAVLFKRPNRWQSWYTFAAYVMACLQLRGNGYIFIVRDDDGSPRSLIPISPDRCTKRLSPKGWFYYDIWHPAFGDRGVLTVHQDDMIHLMGFSLDGFIGLSAVTAGAEAMGLSLATQQHGANLFRQGTQASGVLKKAEGTLTPVAAQNLRESWQNHYGGVANGSKVLILEEGLTFEKLSMTSDEAQFLETRKFQVEEICRIFRVPPHKVASLDRATFSNIENQNQQYIDDSLVPPARQLELEMEDKLVWASERGRLRILVDFDSMLRGDMKSRFEAYNLALAGGYFNRDEARDREGLPPIPGGAGQEFRVALNTGPATAPGDTPAAS